MANECRLILIGTTFVLLLANRIGDVSTEDVVTKGGSAAATDVAADAGQTRSRSEEENNQFIRKLFNKYGNEGVMTFEGLEHLLENLGLGNVHIRDHDVHDHHTGEGFEEFHPSHEHNDTEDGWNRTNPAAQMQKQDGEHHRDDQRHQHHHHHKHHHKNQQQQQQKGKGGRKGSKVKSNRNRTESATSSDLQDSEENKKGVEIKMFRSGGRVNETSATPLPVDDSSKSDKVGSQSKTRYLNSTVRPIPSIQFQFQFLWNLLNEFGGSVDRSGDLYKATIGFHRLAMRCTYTPIGFHRLALHCVVDILHMVRCRGHTPSFIDSFPCRIIHI